jgi:sugar phosphate isomerase/epimerase
MKLTCQEHLAPGETLLDKWRFLEAAGWDGFELLGAGDGAFRARAGELRGARDAGVPMRTVCVQGGPFIGDADPEARARAVATMKELLSGIAEAGGTGAITPSSYGVYTTSLPPYARPRSPEEDRESLLAVLTELGEHAAREGVLVLLEPLNRYEDYVLNRLDQAVELADAVGLDSVRVMGDLYHMNIEEDDPLEALRTAAPRLAHVHLSDSNRAQPFAGHVDWGSVLATLAESGYEGDLGLECRLRGEPEEALAEVAGRLRPLLPAQPT